MHVGLGEQDEKADSVGCRALDDGLEQGTADASALRLGGDGKRSDLGFGGTRHDLAAVRPGLKHDRAGDRTVESVRARWRRTYGHEYVSDAVGSEFSQARFVLRVLGQVLARAVSGNSKLSDLCHLILRSVTNQHESRLSSRWLNQTFRRGHWPARLPQR